MNTSLTSLETDKRQLLFMLTNVNENEMFPIKVSHGL